MKKTFQLIQILQNLQRIKRTGGNLFLGIPAELNYSVAEHSYMVTYLSMLFTDLVRGKDKIDSERLLRYCLVHDWVDSIISDLPSASPSYASFWKINIREETAFAEDKAMEAILKMIKEEIDISKYQEMKLNEIEKNLFKAADISALLFEMLEWKYSGLKHEGWEMIWFNTVDRLEKINLSFIPNLVKLFKEAYKKGTKPANLFLAQPGKQSNPEHK